MGLTLCFRSVFISRILLCADEPWWRRRRSTFPADEILLAAEWGYHAGAVSVQVALWAATDTPRYRCATDEARRSLTGARCLSLYWPTVAPHVDTLAGSSRPLQRIRNYYIWYCRIKSGKRHRPNGRVFSQSIYTCTKWHGAGTRSLIKMILKIFSGKTLRIFSVSFLSISRVSTLTRDIDIAILSVRPSVCLSVCLVSTVAAQTSRPGLRSADTTNYVQPRTRTKFGERAFSYVAQQSRTCYQMITSNTNDKQFQTQAQDLPFHLCF